MSSITPEDRLLLAALPSMAKTEHVERLLAALDAADALATAADVAMGCKHKTVMSGALCGSCFRPLLTALGAYRAHVAPTDSVARTNDSTA